MSALTIAWFPCAILDGVPALGEPETTTWANFVSVFTGRREGPKDGPCFAAARFTLEPDGRRVRRLKRNLLARTAIVLDCESHKATGEIPPDMTGAADRVRRLGWSAVLYTSHNHRPHAPRYRIVLQLPAEIDHNLPAVEVIADRLDLAGVIDGSKIGAASLFYLPSAEPGQLDHHDMQVIDGAPIDAAWLSAHVWRAGPHVARTGRAHR